MAALNDITMLECPVCYERYKPPINTCENGHGICNKCRKLVNSCGICRKKFTASSNTLLNEIIENISIKCQYSPQGCKESFSTSAIDEHEKNCYSRKDKCAWCVSEFFLAQMNNHFKTCEKNRFKGEIGFLTPQKITCKVTEDYTNLYYNLYITDITTFFQVCFLDNREKIFFCVQYLGKDQENAKKYKYDIKIDQGLSPPNQSYFCTSGLCIPYFYSADEVKKQDEVIELKLK